MNADQIRKLQNKVAKQVRTKFEADEKKEKEEREVLLSAIKRDILGLQSSNSSRGACFCVCNNDVYGVNPKTQKVEPVSVSSNSVIEELECVKTEDGRKYYMMSEEQNKEEMRLMHWVADKYPVIRMALVAQKKPDIHAKMTHLLMLGDVVQ
jgi:hypothetical protein